MWHISTCLHLCWHFERESTNVNLPTELGSIMLTFALTQGMMEMVQVGLHTPWHVEWSRIQPPCLFSPSVQPTPVMASSYSSPFEGTGDVKEGFLCALCLKDLQSFYQLQDHYEEEHSGDERHVRGQLKSEYVHSHSLTPTVFHQTAKDQRESQASTKYT